jgi:signal transduction histidine kinase
MIITDNKAENYVSIGENDDYIEAGIDSESLPLFFELMSKGIYANPIGSICREVVSNCYDANVENNKASELVVVSINDDFGEYSIEFKDKGIGISEERIQKVFMNYLSSTKRETNNQIGGFGLIKVCYCNKHYTLGQ